MQYILFAYKLVLYYNSKRGGWTFPGGLVMRIYFRASYYCTYAINPCIPCIQPTIHVPISSSSPFSLTVSTVPHEDCYSAHCRPP